MNKLLIKTDGECVVQRGFLAKGQIKAYFKEELAAKKQVVPIIVSTAFLDNSPLLTKTLLSLAKSYTKISSK